MSESPPDTSVPLKEFIEAKLDAMDRVTETARVALEKRLDGMNEFRGALRDQNDQMATRAEVKEQFTGLRNETNIRLDSAGKDIRLLQDYQSKQEGKASQMSMLVALGLAVAGVVISLITLFVKH